MAAVEADYSHRLLMKDGLSLSAFGNAQGGIDGTLGGKFEPMGKVTTGLRLKW